MGTLLKAFNSTVGRKAIMGLTGLGLVVFIIEHLLGNLELFFGSASFNGYVEWLHSFGSALTVSEFGLLALFLLHIVMAIVVTLRNRAARPVKYSVTRSKGAPSLSNVSSRNMIVTGLVLLAFLGLHLWQFRFGPAESLGYVTQVNGKGARDLYRLVSETFQNPLFVAIYVGVMVFLGLHIRHGFWSAFQSLGAMAPHLSKPIYLFGTLLALLLALGFLVIPIWLYIGGH
jgi:succinate dehydrogenase / fumarate reductase cytochrome b subunit